MRTAVPLAWLGLATCFSPPEPAATTALPRRAATTALPRRVRVAGQRFVLSASNQSIVMAGPNVVVKGPPYLPSVSGDSYCHDVTDGCAPNCESCTTFNEADAAHLKTMGWNAIRLGVVWAGAQPRDEDTLDAGFVARLHAVLNLTDAAGIHVILDNHGDMVGTAGCGNGVPMWVQQKAAPDLIGKPLKTELPYSLIPSLRIDKVSGYDHCGGNATAWAQHAGDPNFNLLNECCLAMNGPNPGGLGYTSINQKTMAYVMDAGAGRAAFVRFWGLLAAEVQGHPSAFAAELMNEPMYIFRREMYQTWRAAAEAIHAQVPDMAVALADTGEGVVMPSWVSHLPGGASIDIDSETEAWIKSDGRLFYAWHWYGEPKSAEDAVKNAQAISAAWGVPSIATEFMGCSAWKAAAAANISHLCTPLPAPVDPPPPPTARGS